MDLIPITSALSSHLEGGALQSGGEKSVTTKVCQKCRQELDVSSFGRNAGTPDGLRYRCKPCARADRRLYASKNQEKQRASHRRWRLNNPEKVRAIQARWRSRFAAAARLRRQKDRKAALERERRYRDKRRSSINEYSRTYRMKNKASVSEGLKKWKAKNRFRVLESIRRRYAAKRTSQVGRVSYAAIYERDNGICHLCGEKPDKIHFDHVVPLSKGGAHVESNIKVACARCNLKKGARLLAA